MEEAKVKIKEHPIIFSTESVKAILEGRKTQTRRVIESKLVVQHNSLEVYQEKGYYDAMWRGKNGTPNYCDDLMAHCPYGQVGDRLWVKETWKQVTIQPPFCQEVTQLRYKADCLEKNSDTTYWVRWHSPRFMFRWASRINLEITGLRVERLQEITEEDMAREGVEVTFHSPGDFGLPNPCATAVVDLPNGQRRYSTALCCWQSLWDSLNAKRGYSWAMNPWVWVIEFKILQ